MKKKDIFLVIAILVISVGAVIGYRMFTKAPDKNAADVVITVYGEEIGRYPLNENQKVEIHADYGTSILEIKDGEAKMIHAGCPDQICVDHNAISQDYDKIICIPNQIIVKIEGGEESNLDSVAQ